MRQHWDAERCAVWAIRDQRADIEYAAEMSHLGMRGGDGVDAMLQRMGEGGLGTLVDNAGFRNDRAHPDADRIYDCVTTCDDAGLLIEHARAGIPPAWQIGGLRVLPMLRPGARARDRIVERSTEELHDYCPVQYINGPEEVRLAREEYTRWHLGITELDYELRRVEFETVTLSPLRAKARPWETLRCERVWTESERFAFLVAARSGSSADELARRFGMTKRQVYQRLSRLRRAGELRPRQSPI